MSRIDHSPSETALLFPTGGAHWPGMGQDLDGADSYGPWIDRAASALEALGAKPGALRQLMAGENQARRVAMGQSWQWLGDFPLSVAAQTVVGSCLGHAFKRLRGEPAAVLGESMGDCAAYCVAGALELEDAVRLAYRWAQALEAASARLGLRMVVVEYLERSALLTLAEPFAGRLVVAESPGLNVLSVPLGAFGELKDALGREGATMLVSTNPCVAHDPRLKEVVGLWEPYEAFVAELDLSVPSVPLLSALQPGARLATTAELRQHLLATTSTQVRWDEAVAGLPALGVHSLLEVGLASRAYSLEKLRSEEPKLTGIAIRALRTLASVTSSRPSLLPPAGSAR